MNNMKKILSFILALCLIFSLAACGSKTPASTPETPAPEDTAPTPDAEPTPSPETQPEEPESSIPEGTYVSYFSLFLSETPESYKALTANDDFMGGAYVEYMGGDIKKIGTFDFTVLEELAQQLAVSGIVELNGTSEYADGEAFASMYIELSDGTSLTADYSGVIGEEYIAVFNTMETWFAELTADLEEYVPQAMVMGELDADLLAEMQEIVNNSGMDGLDSLAISDIALDEFFAFTAGLSSSNGIVSGASCAAMMMTTPYSLVIVKLDEATSVESIRADFESSLDWHKWVCVIPSNALIAEKDGMVLCLMGSDAMFDFTAAAIEAAGWTNITTIDNPDM